MGVKLCNRCSIRRATWPATTIPTHSFTHVRGATEPRDLQTGTT